MGLISEPTMFSAIAYWQRPLLCLALFCLGGLGCQQASNDRYIPAPDLARTSLIISLDAWSAGHAAARLDGQSPVVQVADSQRRKDQRLERYQIIGELPIDGGRRFEVELYLTEPRAVERTQYVVVGIDPIWVIRREDFDMITHWDHPMPQEKPPQEKATIPETKGAGDE